MTPQQIEIVDNFRKETPVRLAALANELGLEVFRSSLKPDVSGLIEPSETAAAGYRIKINRHETAERQRFTLAHEIAHFLLHKEHIGGGVVDTVMYRSSLSSKKEVEANKLAAKLIMPMSNVQAERQKLLGMDDDQAAVVLASKFKVSLPAMRIRLGL
jgi:Zn-dependent peptidase ImmA (M78 family)